MEPILQKQYSIILYKSSYLSLLSTLYCYYRQHYTLVFVPGTVFLTSINYWRHPTNSWRRWIDIGCVVILGLYQIKTAWTAENRNAYYTFVLSAIGCYPVGYHYYNNGMYLESTYLQVLLHILMAVANITLYHGKI